MTVRPLGDYFKKHRLLDVIVITLLASISDAEGWKDIQRFAEDRKAQLKKFLLLEKGITQHDIYCRVFVRLIPEQIEVCFMAWIRSIRETSIRKSSH